MASFFRFFSLHRLQQCRRYLLGLLSFLLLIVLACNGATIFCLPVPFPAKIPLGPARFLPENVARISKDWQSASTKQLATLMYSVKEENSLPILQKSHEVVVFPRKRRRKHRMAFKMLHPGFQPVRFSTRVKDFFTANSCGIRFFMTWISSFKSFGERELFTVQSLFKSHPNGCLVIVSSSIDSKGGMNVLKPFSDNGFRVIAISPDCDFLFKSTLAESWLHRLRRGEVDPGGVSLGQNLSNLLRLTLLYKFGGAYIDTDVIILKSFTNLRNAIGAQTVDLETGNWTRLNNAVMVFDKGHPILLKFIEEFARTFNGNKWGYNGPYLVSRVVQNLKGSDRFDVNILKPMAFYPLDWSRIRSLFQGPKNEAHSKWLHGKLNHIRSKSYAVHLWNRQSKKIKIEEGSIIAKIISDCCVFCNSSASGFGSRKQGV